MRADDRRRLGQGAALAAARLAQRYAATETATATHAAVLVSLLWDRINPFESIGDQWARLNDQAAEILADAQRDAALMALSYIQSHADAHGVPEQGRAPAIEVESAVVGRSQTGRSLGDVLRRSEMTARSLIWSGMAPDQAWRQGRSVLWTTVQTEVGDAAREVLNTEISLDERITGYERLVTLPACDRCLVLAGRTYRFSEGFQRHPNCNGCVHVPTYLIPGSGVIGGVPSDHTPDALVADMSPAQRTEVFGPEGAEALDAGAEVSAVVQGRHSPPRRISRADAATARRLGIERGEINANKQGRGRSLRWLRARWSHQPHILREELARNGWLAEAATI